MTYKAPTRDILFSTVHLADLEGVAALPGNEEVNATLVQAILQEAAKIGEDVLAPINRSGDINGAQLTDGKVHTAAGWKEAYTAFIEGGWNGLPFSPERGGQGLPWLVATATQEIWYAANMAFSLCSLLTQGVIEAIDLHGSDAQKDTYMNNLISGVWSGTMNLTEPHAGSDLATIKTRAVADGDHYLISGQKIFISYGDHDLTENIIHLVLARLPDAPAGVKGLSLFIVPKFLVDKKGEWGVRNDIETVSLEHKLGIHGSPTAVLAYGSGKYPVASPDASGKAGAVGYLVGQPHHGMSYMFTVMNIDRLAIGVEGNGVADRAYQQAVQFANERVQGTAIDDPKGEHVTIVNHPDIKRMLMLQKCRIEALRSLGLVLGASFDKSHKHPEQEVRLLNQAMVEILTPIVKAYTTEMGIENVSLALQVHGGMGFIEETGIAQHYRDQRITAIYEGTNGIQALDLVGRKLLRDQGNMARTVLEHIHQEMESVNQSALRSMRDQVTEGLNAIQQSIGTIMAMANTDIRQVGAICDPYLRLWGTVLCGWQLARAASVAINLDDGDPFYNAKIETAKFYFASEMPKVATHLAVIKQSADCIANLDTALFETLQ